MEPMSQGHSTEGSLETLDEASGESTVSIGEVLISEKENKGRKKMYVAAVSSLLTALTAGLITGYSAPATYDMTTNADSPFLPNADEVTWIGSVLSLGAMPGSLCGGPLADKIGRKNAIVYNIIPLMAGWLSISMATNVYVVIIGRILTGFACGVIMVTVPTYCVEISVPSVRGLLGSATQGFLVIGNLLSVFIGYYVSWQILALNAACFSAFAFFCFLPMPESPRLLLAKGKLNLAIQVMQDLQGSKGNAVEECNAIYEDMKNGKKGRLSIKELKQPIIYKPALISMGLMFFQQFSGLMAIFSYSSYIFDSSKSFLDPKKATIVIGAVQVMATLPSNLIVDKAGRKLLLIISGSLMALSLLSLGTYYYIARNQESIKETYNWLPLVSLIFYVIAYSLGYGPIPMLLTAEMVPMRARTSISGVSVFFAGLFSFIVIKTFIQLEETMGAYGTFWLYGTIALIGVAFSVFIVPETKGKKLEDISKIFSQTNDNNEDVLER